MKRVHCIFNAIIAIIFFVLVLFPTGCGTRGIALPDEATLSGVLEREGYRIVWSDEFDGNTLDTSKWRAGYDGNVRRAGYYETTPDTLFLQDGNLVIRTHYKENGAYGAGWYTSWVESAINKGHAPKTEDYQGFNAKYGYFEVRCKVPASIGIWSAFWLMPDEGVGMTADDLPGTGSDGVEIDVMESPWFYQKGKDKQELNVHVLHADGYQNTKSDRSATYRIPDMATEFHTYGVMWTETEYVFYVDGKETWRSVHTVDGKSLGVSQVKEYLLLTVEVAGQDPENPGRVRNQNGEWEDFWCGNPDRNDKSKVYDFVIDYVRVYQKG